MAGFELEHSYWAQGLKHIAGVDEAGRGPLAGPVVAAAVILTPEVEARLRGLTDSKKLSEKRRDQFFGLIQSEALDYAVGIVSAQIIDRINILQATFLAMQRALQGLDTVEQALIDGNKTLPYWSGPQAAIVKGDSKSLSIAAASIIAKVVRDRIMVALAHYYPDYGFAQHKGYPTALHRRQVQALGLSPQHRLSFCRKLLAEVSP